MKKVSGVDWNSVSDKAEQRLGQRLRISHAKVIRRDQPNSREKMHDFTAEFLKCVKFHGKFTERVSEIHGAHRRYFKVVC